MVLVVAFFINGIQVSPFFVTDDEKRCRKLNQFLLQQKFAALHWVTLIVSLAYNTITVNNLE